MNEVDEIKSRIDIVEFIGQYLELRRAGINYSALCPFHSEKTPSFMVSHERQSFRCFGCGESGDIFTFLEKMEGMTFPEALKHLADRAGVVLPQHDAKKYALMKDEKDIIYKTNLIAAKYFKAMLWSRKGEEAKKYLLSRGLLETTIEKFKIGFAPKINELAKYVAREKLSMDSLKLAGSPERFSNRIMFPIFDSLSNVVGFSGRQLDEKESFGPKYLNTPETRVFHKSRAVYGINFAKDAIRRKQKAILVEGQMDVIMSHQVGLEETVASSGTALTEEHLRIISRFSLNIVLSFDEDEAGQKAAISAARMCLEQGLDLKLTILEGFKDAGEAIKENKKKWIKSVEQALPPVEWIIKKKLNENPTVAQKKEVASFALSFIARMQDEVEKAHYLQLLANVLVVPAQAIGKSLEKIKSKNIAPEQIKIERVSDRDKFFSFLLNFPKLVVESSPSLSRNKKRSASKEDKRFGLSQREMPHGRKFELRGLPEIEFDLKEDAELYNKIRKCYSTSEKLEKELISVTENLERDRTELFKGIAIEWDGKIGENQEEAIAEFRGLLRKLQDKKIENVKKEYANKIAVAEIAGDIKKVKQLMNELQDNLKT